MKRHLWEDETGNKWWSCPDCGCENIEDELECGDCDYVADE